MRFSYWCKFLEMTRCRFHQEDDDGRLAYSTPRWPLQVTSKPATVTVAGIPTHYAAPGFKSQVIKVFSGLDFTLLEAAKGRQRKYVHP
jgi:hypothetical protein